MTKSHSWFFYLCALEGAAAIAALFLIPSEGGRLSLARLALIGFIAALCVVWIYTGSRSSLILDKVGGGQVNGHTREPIHRFPVYVYACILLSLIFGLSLFLLRYLNPETSLSAYQRLSPLLWYLLLLAIQFSFFFLIFDRGFHPANLSSRRSVYLSAIAAFGLLLLLLLFISITRLGLTPDPAYWGEPGVPVLGWQFTLAVVGGIFILWLTFSDRTRAIDFLLPFVIYLIALIVWLSVPADVLANSFYMPINPPTFQPFPYSDAGYYDQMAHSLLIGHPYQGTIPTRPLYIFLLTILHRLFGENYRNIIVGQTFVLAIIPVVFYALGKKLHSRVAGVIIALFFIFRELTTLLVSSNSRVSNTKTLMVDLPTLLLLILACFFTIRWLEHKTERNALIAGGTFGLLLLLRTQSMLVLPLILLVALLVIGWKTKRFFLLSSFFILGLLVTILPWLTHNYLQTGQFAFDAPFQYKVIASQYAYSGNLDIESYDFEGKGLGRVLLEFALKDPGFVFGFITNHFLAAQIHGLLALPLIKPYNGIFEPVNLYWMDWNGTLEWYNFLLIIFYLAVIAVGLGSAWKRWRWIGLVPLAFSAGYAFATAVGRFSGWRYDLPADWIWYFYFGMGVAELLVQAALLFGAEEVFRAPENHRDYSERSDEQQRHLHRTHVQVGAQTKRAFVKLFNTAILFAFIGALPWLAKNMGSPRYLDQSEARLVRRINALSDTSTVNEINSFLSQPEAFLQTGRVLYPRFFGKEDGLASTNPWPAYAIRDYPRVGLLFLNQSSNYVVFPTKRVSEFPHAQDAIILGCKRDGYVEARWIVFPELDSAYSSEAPADPCSP